MANEERMQEMKTKKKHSALCKTCGKIYSKSDIVRTLGKESMPYQLGFCSAFCYTKYVMIKPEEK
jgi:hypothetical protein